MAKEIICICARTAGNNIVFVKTATAKDDGMYMVTTSFNPAEAMDFKSIEEADKIIPRIVNPWERNYGAVQIETNTKANRELLESNLI